MIEYARQKRFKKFAAALSKLEPVEILGVARLLGVAAAFDKEEEDEEKVIGLILSAFESASKDKQKFLLEVLMAATR